MNGENLFQEWRTADRAAHALEQAITRASLDALSGDGEPPEEELRERARKLRHTADDLFHLAMEEMNARAGRLRGPG